MSKHHLFFLLFLISCSRKGLTEEEKHLNMYLTEKHQMNIKGFPNLMVIVISGHCGSCTEKTIVFLNELDKKLEFQGYKKIIIIPDNNADVADSIRNVTSEIFIEKGFELEKYGINFPKNIILEFKNKDLVFKDWLYLDKIDSIAKKYQLVL